MTTELYIKQLVGQIEKLNDRLESLTEAVNNLVDVEEEEYEEEEGEE